mgnify:CR=1 FL=1
MMMMIRRKVNYYYYYYYRLFISLFRLSLNPRRFVSNKHFAISFIFLFPPFTFRKNFSEINFLAKQLDKISLRLREHDGEGGEGWRKREKLVLLPPSPPSPLSPVAKLNYDIFFTLERRFEEKEREGGGGGEK